MASFNIVLPKKIYILNRYNKKNHFVPLEIDSVSYCSAAGGFCYCLRKRVHVKIFKRAINLAEILFQRKVINPQYNNIVQYLYLL